MKKSKYILLFQRESDLRLKSLLLKGILKFASKQHCRSLIVVSDVGPAPLKAAKVFALCENAGGTAEC